MSWIGSKLVVCSLTCLDSAPDVEFDWAIILGGTNDLTASYDADPIFESLERLWKVPLSHQTKVLALTVPECGSCNRNLDEIRDALNARIMGAVNVTGL